MSVWHPNWSDDDHHWSLDIGGGPFDLPRGGMTLRFTDEEMKDLKRLLRSVKR